MVVAGLLPVVFPVAVSAFLSEPSLVYVVVLMAFYTGGGSLPVLFFGLVAINALTLYVDALELEISNPVVKDILVEQNHPGAAPLVLRMAMLALFSLDIFTPSVKAPLFFYICGDLLVAIETKALLGGLAEVPVAAGAFIFVFGMPLNHLAGHDELLYAAGLSRAGKKHRGNAKAQKNSIQSHT